MYMDMNITAQTSSVEAPLAAAGRLVTPSPSSSA